MGQSVSSLDLSAVVNEADDTAPNPILGSELALHLRGLFGAPGYQPPSLPEAALRVIRLSQRPDTNLAEVIAVVERDPLLCGKVVARAQSALYATRSPVRTLGEAVVRMGLGGLRDLVLEVALNMRVFKAAGFSAIMQHVQRHSVATAQACRLVCRYTSVDAEYAFLCGLLHDIGIAATLILLSADAKTSHGDETWLALDQVHEDASGIVAQLWNLPPEVTLVVGNHHHPKGLDLNNLVTALS